MTTEKQIEQEIQAKGLTAPRITPEHIDACIVKEQYHVFEGTTTTVCSLTLPNGFTVQGVSACASPENFNAEIGRKIAREDARNKIWALEGYLLRQQLHESELGDGAVFVGGLRQDGAIEPVAETALQPHQRRVVDEKEQLGERLGKLSSFLEKGQPDFIDDAEWQRLNDQHMHMNEYHEILIHRINHF